MYPLWWTHMGSVGMGGLANGNLELKQENYSAGQQHLQKCTDVLAQSITMHTTKHGCRLMQVGMSTQRITSHQAYLIGVDHHRCERLHRCSSRRVHHQLLGGR